jgi:hypothetical protein
MLWYVKFMLCSVFLFLMQDVLEGLKSLHRQLLSVDEADVAHPAKSQASLVCSHLPAVDPCTLLRPNTPHVTVLVPPKPHPLSTGFLFCYPLLAVQFSESLLIGA